MSKKAATCIFFVTGASGSGKTAVCDYFKKNGVSIPGAEFEIHDIDENGVPEFGRGHWRRYRVSELLGNATRALAERSTIICGVISPHEVIDSELFHPGIRVYFILLDTSSQAISRRIAKRAAKGDSKGKLKKLIDANIKFSRTLGKQVLMQKNGFVVNTRNKSVKQVSEEILSIIKAVQRSGQLGGQSGGEQDRS